MQIAQLRKKLEKALAKAQARRADLISAHQADLARVDADIAIYQEAIATLSDIVVRSLEALESAGLAVSGLEE